MLRTFEHFMRLPSPDKAAATAILCTRSSFTPMAMRAAKRRVQCLEQDTVTPDFKRPNLRVRKRLHALRVPAPSLPAVKHSSTLFTFTHELQLALPSAFVPTSPDSNRTTLPPLSHEKSGHINAGRQDDHTTSTNAQSKHSGKVGSFKCLMSQD